MVTAQQSSLRRRARPEAPRRGGGMPGTPSALQMCVATLMIVAFFVNRPAMSVGGFTVRLEVFVGVIAAVGVLLLPLARPRRAPRDASPLRRGVGPRPGRRSPATVGAGSLAGVALLLFVWLAWNAMSSFLMSPSRGASLALVAWLTLNVISAFWIALQPEVIPFLIRGLVAGGAVASVVALIAYSYANVFERVTFGVQPDPSYGGFAAYGTSLEANILASSVCLTGLLALANPHRLIGAKLRAFATIAAPFAIIAAHTRAALLAFALGVAVLVITRREARSLGINVAIIGACAALGGALLASDAGLAKFGNLFDTSGGTGAVRSTANAMALSDIRESRSLVTGLGFNSFGQRHFDPTLPGLDRPGYIAALPLQLLYDAGIVALFAVGACVVLVLAAHKRRGSLSIAIALSSAYCVFSLATSTLWLFTTWMMVGLALGTLRLGWGAGAAESRHRNPKGRPTQSSSYRSARAIGRPT